MYGFFTCISHFLEFLYSVRTLDATMSSLDDHDDHDICHEGNQPLALQRHSKYLRRKE